MMFFLFEERGAENVEKMKKIDKRKTLKIDDKEKLRVQGKSNKNKHLWFLPFILETIFCSKTVLKSSLHHHILFTAFMLCRVFETG